MKKLLFYVISFLVLFMLDASASTSLESTMCNAYNVATGPAGKVLGSFAIVSLGVGFFTGRISWTLMIAVSIGVGAMTAAPQVVSVLTGKDIAECIDGTYVTTCANGECYSCPMGYGGTDCASCGVGFTGADCTSCALGYRGDNCSECDTGYTRYEGVCHRDCQISQVGVTKTEAKGGVGILQCDAENFTGSIDYACLDNNFSISKNNCECMGNYAEPTCSTCNVGYSLSSFCVDCDSNYTKIGNLCYANCISSSVPGISLSQSNQALPPNGSMTCNVSDFVGNIDYSCDNGLFSTTNNTACAAISQCYGADEGQILTLNAPSGVWRSVVFAEYGTPPDSCVSSETCSVSIVSYVENQCLGQSTCQVAANNAIHGDPCYMSFKRIRVRMTYY